MAAIKETIYKKYGIDIDVERDIIVKKYKFTDGSISDIEVEELIATALKKWQKTVDSGTMEKQIEEAKKRLEESPKYEKLLRDKKLRVELGKYYNNSSGSEDLPFAKEYFAIIATTKKINKDDVDFYVKCFPEERKKKKAIIEMLTKEYKVKFNEKDSADDSEESEEDAKKKKKERKHMVVNMFSSDTVSQIIFLDKKYKEAQTNKNIYDKYPGLNDDISTFLRIGDYKSQEEFATYIGKCKTQAFAIKQDFGNEYGVLVDVYNIMDELLDVNKHQDVHDSFAQFKVLLYYPNLTPYMFPLENAKKNTIEKLFKVAKETQKYGFKNVDDFINTYYVLVYENFNIDDSSIASMLSRAKKNANKVLKDLEKNKKKSGAETGDIMFNVLYALAFWPLYLLFFIYEVIKTVVWHLKKVAFAAFIPLVFLNSKLIKPYNAFHISNFKMLFNHNDRIKMFSNVLSTSPKTGIHLFLFAFGALLFMALIYLFIPVLVTYASVDTSSRLKKQFDWIGLERTFKKVLGANKERFLKLKKISKSSFTKKTVFSTIWNIIYTAIVIFVLLKSDDFIRTCFAKPEIVQEDVVEEIVEEPVLTDEELWMQEIMAMPEFKGHHYKVYEMEGYTWDLANDFCKEKGGHLVTITSEEEQVFVESLITLSDENYNWIDARLGDNNKWKWSTDELFSYTCWNQGEPNSLDIEKVAILWPDKWNNLPEDNTERPKGFVFEYDGDIPANIVWYQVKPGESPVVRTGPGKNNDAICETSEGDYIMGTGNFEVNDAGNTWYEVYIDNFCDRTGYIFSGGVEEVAR